MRRARPPIDCLPRLCYTRGVKVQSPPPEASLPFFDLSKRRPAHINPAQQRMAALQPNEEYEHDHSPYSTPFAVWLAQNRQRLSRPFTYRPGARKGVFLISVSADE